MLFDLFKDIDVIIFLSDFRRTGFLDLEQLDQFVKDIKYFTSFVSRGSIPLGIVLFGVTILF